MVLMGNGVIRGSLLSGAEMDYTVPIRSTERFIPFTCGATHCVCQPCFLQMITVHHKKKKKYIPMQQDSSQVQTNERTSRGDSPPALQACLFRTLAEIQSDRLCVTRAFVVSQRMFWITAFPLLSWAVLSLSRWAYSGGKEIIRQLKHRTLFSLLTR